MNRHAKNVIISGSPGAWGNVVAKLLAKEGWKICWKNQDLNIRNGVRYFECNGENVEIENIHRYLDTTYNCSRYSKDLPVYLDVPYPGPVEFIQQFGEHPVVIYSRSIAPCLQLWKPAADIVIDVRATEEEDLQAMQDEVGERLSFAQLVEIRQHQLDRYSLHLKLFSKVFTMTNAEVKDCRFKLLMEFLNSVI